MFLSKEEEANRLAEFIAVCGDWLDVYENNGYLAFDDYDYNYAKETAKMFKNLNYFDARELAKKLEYHLSLYTYSTENDVWICKDKNLKKSLDEIKDTNIIRL